MKRKEHKVIVVMPTYNAELTIEKTFRDIPEGSVNDIILTDNASTDNTVEVAKRLEINVLYHKQNKGYGANQKTCYDDEAFIISKGVYSMEFKLCM